jgi:hypothetical protein
MQNTFFTTLFIFLLFLFLFHIYLYTGLITKNGYSVNEKTKGIAILCNIIGIILIIFLLLRDNNPFTLYTCVSLIFISSICNFYIFHKLYNSTIDNGIKLIVIKYLYYLDLFSVISLFFIYVYSCVHIVIMQN